MDEVANAAKLSRIEAIRDHEVDEAEARSGLKELLADPDAQVRAEAASAIWEHADEPSLVEKALELSTWDKDSTVRIKATSALGRVLYEGDMAGAELEGYKPDELLGEPSLAVFKKVKERLLELAKDEKRSIDERRFALEGLGFLGNDGKIKELIESFWLRVEPQAKLSAVFAMGRSGDTSWAGKIQEALAAKDAELRIQAAWAAGEAEIAGASDALVRIAKEGASQDERVAAISALGRLGGEKAAKELLGLAEGDKDNDVRDAASQALEEIALLDALDKIEGEDDDA